MAQDRVYINQCSLREKVFDNGGSLINAAFKVSELQEHADENGWVNIVIAKRREVSEKGATHYAYKDLFLEAIFAKGIPFAFETKGTVLLALGFTSIIVEIILLSNQ